MATDPSSSELSPTARRNRKVALYCALGFVGMIGAAYASVPLYKAFCQVTGFDGSDRVTDPAAHARHEHPVLVAQVDHLSRDAEPGDEQRCPAGNDRFDLGLHVSG